MIRDSQQGFEFSWLNSLLTWALSQQDKKMKITGIIKESMTFKWKVILTLWTLNCIDYVPFSCIGSFHVVYNQANSFKKI